jgi:hypothetical protein
MMILSAALVLSRKQWLIAPIIGIALTFTSALYSTTVYPVVPCGSNLVSQGFPYPWIRRFGLPSNGHCIIYYEPIDNGSRALFVPNPIIGYIWFITDAVFYTLLALAILELVAGTRRYKSSSSLKATASPHPGIAPRGRSEKTTRNTDFEHFSELNRLQLNDSSERKRR